MFVWTVSGFSLSSTAALSAHSGDSSGTFRRAADVVVMLAAGSSSLSVEDGVINTWSGFWPGKARPGNMLSAGIVTTCCNTPTSSQMKVKHC